MEVKKRFARARLLTVVNPSASRVQPLCRYFGDCGGCQYQHIAYEVQLGIKHKQVCDLFERIGGSGACLGSSGYSLSESVSIIGIGS